MRRAMTVGSPPPPIALAIALVLACCASYTCASRASDVVGVDLGHVRASSLLQPGSISDVDADDMGGGDDPWDDDFCYESDYRKRTLKVIKEMPYIGLFEDLKNQTRFEASGHVIAKGYSWVVFDNLRTVGRVDLHFNFRNPNNVLMVEDGKEEEESQFEGLAYSHSTDTFIIVRESWVHEETKKLVGKTEEVKFNDEKQTFHVVRECIIDFEFEDENKGFEGIYYFERDGKRYFMGLCESNYCKTIHGKHAPGLDRGHGRVVVAEMVEDDKSGCEWKTVKVINIPKRAKFLDYSAMSFLGYMGTSVAITSQEDAAVWVGEFDWDNMEFAGKGRVLHLPRDEHCQKIYCNVEGIQWLDDQRVALTSDKSKSTQPHSCMHKDQSFAVMALPKY